jgi:hypothetical protein
VFKDRIHEVSYESLIADRAATLDSVEEWRRSLARRVLNPV